MLARLASLALASTLFLACGAPKEAPPPHVPVAAVAARPDDVGSIEGIVKAYYEVVNVPKDAPRQWDRDRTLYSPWIRFVAVGRASEGHPAEVNVWSHQDLVDESEPLVAQGFREVEIHRTVTRYGNIAHVMSTYETFLAGKTARGVNSLELYWDGKRWWIASAMWQSEDADHPIPPELLPPAR
jgi:hypothetical protein